MRVKATKAHGITDKVNKLFKFMEDMKIEVSFYSDRFFISDLEAKNNKDFELYDDRTDQPLCEFPCEGYKLTQEKYFGNYSAEKRTIQTAPDEMVISKT
jgi:hypothetical protein